MAAFLLFVIITSSSFLTVPLSYGQIGVQNGILNHTYQNPMKIAPLNLTRPNFANNQIVMSNQISIPSWIKNNARWWSQGEIGDKQFVLGIQYMIQKGIIKVPMIQTITQSSSATEQIPVWVKNNAGWWASDQISAGAFAMAIQYLITQGIINTGTIPESPCMIPSPADLSYQTFSPSSSSAHLLGHVPLPVKEGITTIVSPLPTKFLLHMELTFKIRNADSFEKCVETIDDPTSSYYRHFLNSQSLGPYIPTLGEKSSVADYLEAHGVNVTEGFSPLTLRMIAPVGVVESLFGIKENIFKEGKNPPFYAPASDPIIPENFANLIDGIEGLDNFTKIKPAQTPCSGPLCPQGVQVAYYTNNVFPNLQGQGENIAIVDYPGDPDMQTAINTYDNEYLLPSTTLNIQYPDGQPSSWNEDWAMESAMDVEAAHTMAPDANIILVYETSGDPLDGVDYVASNHLANIVSNSWDDACEFHSCSDTQVNSATVRSQDDRLALDSSTGLTILFSSGDYGARPDRVNLGTEFPSSDPNVLAVGATNLSLTGCTAFSCSGYDTETGASISGGGYSGYFTAPTWQSNDPYYSSQRRGVPDVSAFGDKPDFWVYSSDADLLKAPNVSCNHVGTGCWFNATGTSLSTPLWAGVMALVQEAQGGGFFGNYAPKFWINYRQQYQDFYPVLSGNNGYAITGGGWNPVAGWGTPITPMLTNLNFANIECKPAQPNINGNLDLVPGMPATITCTAEPAYGFSGTFNLNYYLGIDALASQLTIVPYTNPVTIPPGGGPVTFSLTLTLNSSNMRYSQASIKVGGITSDPALYLTATSNPVTIQFEAPHATNKVTISNGASYARGTCNFVDCFNPQVVSINVGDTVTWTNSDSVSHTATSGKPSDAQYGTIWDSNLIAPGQSYTSPPFNTAGTYYYFDQAHPWMTGEIIVS